MRCNIVTRMTLETLLRYNWVTVVVLCLAVVKNQLVHHLTLLRLSDCAVVT